MAGKQAKSVNSVISEANTKGYVVVASTTDFLVGANINIHSNDGSEDATITKIDLANRRLYVRFNQSAGEAGYPSYGGGNSEYLLECAAEKRVIFNDEATGEFELSLDGTDIVFNAIELDGAGTAQEFVDAINENVTMAAIVTAEVSSANPYVAIVRANIDGPDGNYDFNLGGTGAIYFGEQTLEGGGTGIAFQPAQFVYVPK